MPADEAASRRHMRIVDCCCALAIAFNFMWCSLEGHGTGFVASARLVDPLLNPRGFWLLGMIAATITFFAMPHVLKRYEFVLNKAVPLAGSIGTACFAFASSQDALTAVLIAVVGLFLSGFGYFWFAARCYLFLARMRTFVAIAWIIAAAVLLKTALLPLAAASSWLIQVPLTCAIAPASALLLWCAQRVAGAGTIFNIEKHSQSLYLSAAAQKNFLLLLILSAFLLATVRRLSFWGTWGEASAFSAAPIAGIVELAVMGVCLAIFVYVAFVRIENIPVVFRFQPALVIVLTGLFIASFASADGQSDSTHIIATVIYIDEACAYLLFWSLIIQSLDSLDLPPFRIIGVGGGVYAISSFIWVAAAHNVADIGGAFITLVAYGGAIALMLYTYRESRLDTSEPRVTPSGLGDIEGLNSCAENVSESAAKITDSITERCDVLAAQYRLTPRETEVFKLLAQGRTRAYIQEELVLSVSTVKTHVSHIYAKLGVHDRQGMMDLVLGSDMQNELK